VPVINHEFGSSGMDWCVKRMVGCTVHCCCDCKRFGLEADGNFVVETDWSTWLLWLCEVFGIAVLDSSLRMEV